MPIIPAIIGLKPFVRTADRYNIDNDTFFLTNGTVKFVDAVVQWGLGLTSVHVPHCQCYGIVGIEFCFL